MMNVPLLSTFILAKLLKCVLDLADEIFTEALSNAASEQFQKLKTDVERAVSCVNTFIHFFKFEPFMHEVYAYK